ncbi:hypothetical protein OY187_27775, partial [Mycolicibacterium iranicum]|nr:hypothetical protein [Mycolicibacterium iranicum]
GTETSFQLARPGQANSDVTYSCSRPYGHALIVPHVLMPNGYLLTVATSGKNSPQNPIAFRQHPNASYQGLRMIPGAGPYPLIESYFQRSFGVGTRHRGAAVAMEIKANGSYTAPAI